MNCTNNFKGGPKAAPLFCMLKKTGHEVRDGQNH